MNQRARRQQRECLLAVTLAFLIGGLSWWIVGSEDDVTLDLESSANEDAKEQQTRPRRDVNLAFKAGEKSSASSKGRQPAIDPPPRREQVREEIDGEFEVLILAPDGHPAAGSRLHWRFIEHVDVTHRDREFKRPNWPLDAPETGVTIADASGRIALPRRDAALQIFARSDTAESTAGRCIERILAQNERLTLTLQPCRFVEVHVFDHRGHPGPHIPIGMSYVYSRADTPEHIDFEDIVYSDHQGRARFGISTAQRDYDLLFAPAFPCRETPTLRLSPDVAGSQLGSLNLPPFGRLHLRYHPNDRPGPHFARPPTLDIVAKTSRALPIASPTLHAQRRQGELIMSGPVALGMNFEIHRREGGASLPRKSLHKVVAGPTVAEEVKTHHLEPFSNLQRLRGRVRVDEGSLRPGQTLRLRLRYSLRALSTDTIHIPIDDQGRFDLCLPAEVASLLEAVRQGGIPYSGARGLSWRFKLMDRPRAPRHQECAAVTVDSDFPESQEPIDLGDVVLSTYPRRARGRVVDEKGQAIVGARIWHLQPGHDIFLNEKLDDFELETDPQGQFDLRRKSKRSRASWGIAIWSPGYECWKSEGILDPTQELLVTLRKAGSLCCVLELDDELKPFDVTLAARPSTSDLRRPKSDDQRRCRKLSHNAFELSGMRKGPVELRLSMRAHWAPGEPVVFHREVVDLESTSTHTIDLRGRIPILSLTLSVKGDIASKAAIRISEGSNAQLRPDHTGRFRIPQPLLRQSGWIVCPGHEAKRFRETIPTGTLHLRPIHERPLKLILPPELEMEEELIGLSFRHHDPRTQLRSHTQTIEQLEPLTFGPNATGTWTATLSPWRSGYPEAKATFEIHRLDDTSPLVLKLELP
jgi:hypothetical protein